MASSAQPARAAVVEAVRQLGATSAFEVGCHCGPVLSLLGALPGMGHVAGMDVNETAVAAAQAQGLDAHVGEIPAALAEMQARSVDVVVSSYCLAYVAPADLVATIGGCLRLARLGLVLAEPSAGHGVHAGSWDDGDYAEWRHEYLDAIIEACDHIDGLSVEATRRRLDGSGNNVNALIVARTQWQR